MVFFINKATRYETRITKSETNTNDKNLKIKPRISRKAAKVSEELKVKSGKLKLDL